MIPLQTFKLFSANSLNCFRNDKGEDPEEKTCPKNRNVFCTIVKRDGVNTSRLCTRIRDDDGAGFEDKEGCLVAPEFNGTSSKKREPAVTACYCKSDNCTKMYT